VQFVSGTEPISVDTIRKMMAEPIYPLPNGFPADKDTGFSQQVLGVGGTQSEPMVGPHSVADDLARETETFEAGHSRRYFHDVRLGDSYTDVN